MHACMRKTHRGVAVLAVVRQGTREVVDVRMHAVLRIGRTKRRGFTVSWGGKTWSRR